MINVYLNVKHLSITRAFVMTSLFILTSVDSVWRLTFIRQNRASTVGILPLCTCLYRRNRRIELDSVSSNVFCPPARSHKILLIISTCISRHPSRGQGRSCYGQGVRGQSSHFTNVGNGSWFSGLQMVMQCMSHPEFLYMFAPMVASVLSPVHLESPAAPPN